MTRSAHPVPPAIHSGYPAEMREAEILGQPQRIAPLCKDQLDADTRAFVTRMRAAIGLPETADLPDFVLTMLHHPDLFRSQMDMGTTIFSGAIPPRERELAVLRVGWLMGAPFEWGEHVAIGRRYGVTGPEIERVTAGSAAPGWTAHEAAILRGVEELVSRHLITDETWATLAASWDERQLIEFPMMVGQYVANGFVLNALRIRLSEGNAGLAAR